MTRLRTIADRLLRMIMTAGHGLLRTRRAFGHRRPPGAHALALTPERRVVLVRLRYAPGWRMPGGGREPGEPLEAAVIRELREEVGLTGHGAVTPLPAIDPALALVEDVRFKPRWSWEVERVATFDLDQLPGELSAPARKWLARYGRGT